MYKLNLSHFISTLIRLGLYHHQTLDDWQDFLIDLYNWNKTNND
jgi:hypothetical protein